MPQFVLKSPVVRFGIAYRAGQTIELTEAAGQSLADAGIVAAPPKPAPKAKTKAKTEPAPKAKAKAKADPAPKAKTTPEPEQAPEPEPTQEPASELAPIKTIEAQEIK